LIRVVNWRLVALLDARHVLAATNANGAAFDPNGPEVEFE
jgi:hypothetical protein